MNLAPYDPRAVANFMLDEADRLHTNITNLALQKLLYFAHGLFLIDQKKPLVTGYFEAWQHGPVHPTVYHAFKGARDQAIKFRATREDLFTCQQSLIDLPTEPATRRHVERIMRSYGHLTPGRLVEIAHAKGAPWHFIVAKGSTSIAFGLRIADSLIIDRFKHHKVTVRNEPSVGEPGEDSPFA